MNRFRYYALKSLHVLGYWLYSRWTASGRLALGALAASAILGVDTNISMAYQAFTFLAALVLISLAAERGFRPLLEVSRALPRFGTAGEPVLYRVRVRNAGAAVLREISLGERLADPLPSYDEFRLAGTPGGKSVYWFDRLVGWSRWSGLVARRSAGSVRSAVLPDLPPGGTGEVTLSLLPPRRGVVRLEAVSASRPDPLGLALAVRRFASQASVIVLPRRYPVASLALPGGRKYQQGGVALASLVGESMEFSTLRDYKPGDPLRRIHWKSFARTGRLIVKENHDEYFVRHALVLDTFTGPGGEAVFEEAVSVTASFACTVLTQESLLDLLFVGAEAYHFTAGRGLGGAERMLEILAAVQPCGDKPFEELSRSVALRYRLVSGCILVLVAWDEPRRALTRQLRALGVPLQIFLVRDPASGAALPEAQDGVRVLEVGRIAEGLSSL